MNVCKKHWVWHIECEERFYGGRNCYFVVVILTVFLLFLGLNDLRISLTNTSFCNVFLPFLNLSGIILQMKRIIHMKKILLFWSCFFHEFPMEEFLFHLPSHTSLQPGQNQVAFRAAFVAEMVLNISWSSNISSYCVILKENKAKIKGPFRLLFVMLLIAVLQCFPRPITYCLGRLSGCKTYHGLLYSNGLWKKSS